MENIPQPDESPYEEGDRVRIYLSDEDLDAKYHGLVCEVTGNVPDDLGGLTGREIDNNHYRLRRVDTGAELDLHFRHSDLVPESEWPARS